MSSARLTRVLAALVGVAALAMVVAGSAGAAFLTPEYETTLTGSGDHVIGDPLAIAVDQATHDFYVADRGNQRIEKFDADGNFLFMIGAGVNATSLANPNRCPVQPGDECRAGQSSATFPEIINPTSISVDNSDGPSKGDLYVAQGTQNGGGDTISRFDSSGQLDPGWGGDGTVDVEAIRRVTVSTVDGRVWVLDGIAGIEPGATDGGHVSAYSEDGTQLFLVEQRNDAGAEGTVAVDSENRLWYSDHNGSAYVLDLERYAETENHVLGVIYPGGASHFALNPANDDVLAVFNGYEVMTFEGSCDPSRGFCVPKESFGGGQLNDPRGLAIDGGTNSVYVAVSGGVAVFRSKVVPDVLPRPASVGHDDAVLNAHLDPLGEGDITDCVVEYGPDTGYGTTVPCDQQMPLESAADVSAHLGGLSTETPYHYRFRATNHNGTSNGADRVFTPHWVKGLETGEATDIGPGTANLHGELDPAGESTHYYFEWGTNKNYGHTTPALPGSEATGNGLTQVEASLAGQLTGVTTYHYRLVAVNALGTSVGSDREFTTPLGSSPQLGAVSATATGPTTAVLRADVNPGFSPTAYKFQYGEDATYGHSTVIGAPIGDDGAFHTASVEISGLAPDTTYHFRAVVFNFVDRVTSADLTFTTLLPPAAPAAQGGGAGAVPTPPVQAESRGPRKCKKGFVRKKGKCARKRQKKHHRRGGTA